MLILTINQKYRKITRETIFGIIVLILFLNMCMLPKATSSSQISKEQNIVEINTDKELDFLKESKNGLFSSGYDENATGINWDNSIILDERYPITPEVVCDSNDNTHILWSVYDDGRMLYHQILYANGNWGEKQIIYSKSSGIEIKLDAVADDYGKIHLVYSWGSNYDQAKTYYKTWESEVWSDSERADHGIDEFGNSVPAHAPQIALTKNGIPHIVWSAEVRSEERDFTFRPIYYQRRLESGLWNQAIFTGYSQGGSFDIVITDDDIVNVVYSYKSGDMHRIEYVDKELDDIKWGLHELIGSEYVSTYTIVVPKPILVPMNESLYCFILSLNDETQGLYYRVKTGQSWGDVYLLTNNATNNYRLKLAATTTKMDDIVIAWPNNVNEESTTPGGIYHKILKESTRFWTNDGIITDNSTFAFDPSISVNSIDEVFSVWNDKQPDGDGQALYFSKGFFDADNDNLTNNDEITIYGTDPLDPDTDDDLLFDGEEIRLGYNATNPDEDSDLILDGWEVIYGYDPLNATDATVDFDLDGLTNLEEFSYNSNPNLQDTDSDTINDGDEVNIHGTNPANEDSDYDELNDNLELFTWFTDPLINDTDSDKMHDGYEARFSLDPLVNDSASDPDLDTIINLDEYYFGSYPNMSDSELDGLDDFEEIFIYFTNPLSNDTDHDILTDFYEVTTNSSDYYYVTNNIYQTNPLMSDTDFDNLDDYQEIDISLTNPLVNDTDGDLMLDGYEHVYSAYYEYNPGLDALDPTDDVYDYDSDGLINYEEFLYGTSPFDDDTDTDYLRDGDEIYYGTNPLSPDSDEDGIWDWFEIFYYLTDPTKSDTDDDGLSDFFEIMVYFSNARFNDTDGDTLSDGDEVYIYGSSPTLVDTDGDQLTDPEELAFNSEPSLRDTDGDGMDDYFEFTYGFNPRTNDAGFDNDNDGLSNLEEYWFFANPLVNDTDSDGVFDYEEVYTFFSSPNRNDTDDDNLSDYDEAYVYFTSLIDPDCDDDLLKDGEEVLIYGTDPENADTDGDGYTDYEEVLAGSDPLNPRNNPDNQVFNLVISISVGIIGALLIYYLTPYLFQARRVKSEKEWTKIGLKKRKEKQEKLTKDIQESNK